MANLNDSNIAKTLCNLQQQELLKYFLSVKDNIINDSNYWQMLAVVWIGSEICSPYLRIWRDLFLEPRRNRHKMMKKKDREIWRSLVCSKAPKFVKVYRAMNPNDDVITAISWTLNKRVAQRISRGREIIEHEIPKETIIAYFNRRGEEEIIHLFEEVKMK